MLETSRVPDAVIGKLVRTDHPDMTPADPEHDEVSDPFMFEGFEFYRRYIARFGTWGVGQTRELADRVVLDTNSENVDDGSQENIFAMNAVAFVPPPEPPAVDAVGIRLAEPFTYRNRRFCWVFRDTDEGWQLAFDRRNEQHVAA